MSTDSQAKTLDFEPRAKERAAPGAFTPPKQIGPYELQRLIGRGGMAAVFEAKHLGTGKTVALKVMDPNLRGDPTFVERFLLEVRAAAKLNHPNLLPVLDSGETDGWNFFATPLLEGGTVADLITQMGQLPWALAAELGRQLLDGLDHAHAQGIIHRDLKPENLLLGLNGTLQVADFGIARLTDRSKLTRTGMLVGTAGYMSPEQAQGVTVDGRSDLFTVGILFYEMLTGENPFHSDSPAASITRILDQDLPTLFELTPTVPSGLEAIVDRLLQNSPVSRYATAADARDALGTLLGETHQSHPKLVAEALTDAAKVQRELNHAQASALIAEAKPLENGNGLEQHHAALLLHLAQTLEPNLQDAAPRLQALVTQHKLTFGASRTPKVIELEANLLLQPRNPVLLAQLANLHRLEGNLVGAVKYLKRYLRQKPGDAYVANQLQQLTGERREVRPNHGDGTKELSVLPERAKPDRPIPAAQVPGAAQAGIFLAPVETRSTLGRLLPTLLPWLTLAIALVLGLRWLSQKLDHATQPPTPGSVSARSLANTAVSLEAHERELTQQAAKGLDHAVTLEREGKIDLALAAFQRVIEEYPSKLDATRALLMRSQLQLHEKRFADAKAGFNEFVEKHPGSPDAAEALLRRGQCAFEQLDDEAAARDFNEFVEHHRTSPLIEEAWVLRGELRKRNHDRDDAKADFEQVVARLGPNDPLRQRAEADLVGLTP